MPRICPYGSHIYVFAGQSLQIWDLYRSYMGKKAYMGPMQDPNGINAQILPIWVPYIHVCWVANFTLGPDATPNTETHKNSVRIKAPNSVNASKRKHKNQINHYNKQRQAPMSNSAVCQCKWKPRRAKPKTYRQARIHWLKFYEESQARTAVVQLKSEA